MPIDDRKIEVALLAERTCVGKAIRQFPELVSAALESQIRRDPGSLSQSPDTVRRLVCTVRPELRVIESRVRGRRSGMGKDAFMHLPVMPAICLSLS